jgi:hypothetical protein
MPKMAQKKCQDSQQASAGGGRFFSRSRVVDARAP